MNALTYAALVGALTFAREGALYAETDITQNNVREPFSQSAPITNSFVFYDGEYISLPYIVSRSNYAVCVNGRVVRDFSNHITPLPSIPRTRPVLPHGITKETDRHDERVSAYIQNMRLYLASCFEAKEIADEMFRVYQTLPFVKDVQWDTKRPFFAKIIYQNEETVHTYLLPLSRKAAITPETVDAHVDQACEMYAKRLKSGIVSSISKNAEKVSYKIDTGKYLNKILQTAQSSQLNDKDKARILSEELQLELDTSDESPAFVRKLAVDKQFEERVTELADEKERRRKEADVRHQQRKNTN